jgi:neutral ceramidase
MVAQLTDGFSGYCPTVPALMGGGYSGSAIHWARLEPYAGYKIVEASARLAHELWRE